MKLRNRPLMRFQDQVLRIRNDNSVRFKKSAAYYQIPNDPALKDDILKKLQSSFENKYDVEIECDVSNLSIRRISTGRNNQTTHISQQQLFQINAPKNKNSSPNPSISSCPDDENKKKTT